MFSLVIDKLPCFEAILKNLFSNSKKKLKVKNNTVRKSTAFTDGIEIFFYVSISRKA